MSVILAMLLSMSAALTAHADETYGDFTYATYIEVDENEVEHEMVTITGYNKNAAKIVIPEQIDGKTVTYIDWDVFKNNTKLEEITLPSGLMGMNATFSGCTNLRKVNFPEEVSHNFSMDTHVIDTDTFRCCESLVNLSLPKGVTRISSDAFYACSSLSAIFIPDTVKILNKNAFKLCYQTIDVYYEGTEEQWSEIIRPAGETIKNLRVHYNSDGIPNAEITAAVKTEDGLSVTANVPYTCRMITAVYNDKNVMTDVKFTSVTSEDTEIPVEIDTSGAAKAKVFLWQVMHESLPSGMIPICEAKEFDL